MSWCDLELAFCNTQHGIHRYLDLVEGRVVAVTLGSPSEAATLRWVDAAPERFVRVESISSREQHEWMTRFITTVEDPQQRERLSQAVLSPGPFRRFKAVLRDIPCERLRWSQLRAELLREHIEAWLHQRGILLRESSTPQAEPPVGDAANELRRVAVEQLEQLSKDALDHAIGFLRYLESRASAAAQVADKRGLDVVLSGRAG